MESLLQRVLTIHKGVYNIDYLRYSHLPLTLKVTADDYESLNGEETIVKDLIFPISNQVIQLEMKTKWSEWSEKADTPINKEWVVKFTPAINERYN